MNKLYLAGGALLAGSALAWWQIWSTVDAIKKGVGYAPAFEGGTGGSFKVHATGYWPATARSDEKSMEGKNEDRIGAPLHTIEDFIAGRSDHVSISGDIDVFPYGQKLLIEGWPDAPNLVGRVTDTGSHFYDAGGLVKKGKASKVYRVIGEEPLDFCVVSSKTFVPKHNVVAQIVVGDHWISRTKRTIKELNTSNIRDQNVVTGLYGIDVFTARRAA